MGRSPTGSETPRMHGSTTHANREIPGFPIVQADDGAQQEVRGRTLLMDKSGKSDSRVRCAGRRMFHAGGSPARPPSKRGLKPKAGVMPRRAS
jgi:hypothetical protein